MSEFGLPAGWPIFDHVTLGHAQVSNFENISGPPQSGRIKTFGGPSRSRTKRQRGGLILNINWLMTNAQVQVLRDFWDTELVYGQYPFAMEVFMEDLLVWRACRFINEFIQEPRSATDWTVAATMYVGYFPAWALKPGAVPMPYQVPVAFSEAPDPIGFLIPEAPVSITIESHPSYFDEIIPFAVSELAGVVDPTLIIQGPLVGNM